MEPIYDRYFLNRYKAGECSQDEIAKFIKWLENYPEQKEIPWVKEIWEESSEDNTIVLGAEEKIFQQVLAHITISHLPTHSKNLNVHKTIYLPERSIWQEYAILRYVSILLIVLIPLLIVKLLLPPVESIEEVVYVKKSTENGRHLSFKLEDGTIITLNANSNISFPEHFSDSSRVVTLVGEAFFEIAKDSSRPFTVNTGDVLTTALGTSFNLCFEKDKYLSKISLISGAVKIEMKSENGAIKDVYLKPGKQAICRPRKGIIKTSKFDALEVTGWKDGIIYFKSAGIMEIVKTLEKWYDVDIEIVGSPDIYNKTEWNYSGQFQNQTLENVLIGIGYVKDFSFKIENKKVKLMFNQNIYSHEIKKK